jgi:hypothetical protein
MKKLVFENGYALYERLNIIYEYDKTRVYLINNEDYEYSIDHPCVDTEYECSGVVIGHSGPNRLIVRWENGCENSYNPEDLDILFQRAQMEPDNPNRKFKEMKYKVGLDRRKKELKSKDVNKDTHQSLSRRLFEPATAQHGTYKLYPRSLETATAQYGHRLYPPDYSMAVQGSETHQDIENNSNSNTTPIREESKQRAEDAQIVIAEEAIGVGLDFAEWKHAADQRIEKKMKLGKRERYQAALKKAIKCISGSENGGEG